MEMSADMPNWCYNYMTVNGPKPELRRFVKAITIDKVSDPMSDETYDMNQLVPLDPRATVVRTTERVNDKGETETSTYSVFADISHDGFDGYGHANQLWGSKWGAVHIEIDDPDSFPKNTLSIRYESAWCPPDRLIEQISRQFPKLTFGTVSTEESDAFAVWSVIHNGEIVEQGGRDTELSSAPQEIQDMHEKLEGDSNDLWDEYYDAMNDWQNQLRDECETEMDTVVAEYANYLKYVARCKREGRTPPRTFISSI